MTNSKYIYLFVVYALLLNGCLFFKNSASIAGEKNIKAWVIAEDVPLTKEPLDFTDWLCLLNYGQAVKILKVKGNWVNVELIDEPYWKYYGSQWVEANGINCTSDRGWLSKTLLTRAKPAKPNSERLILEGFSPSCGK